MARSRSRRRRRKQIKLQEIEVNEILSHTSIINQIRKERIRQDDQWGGPEHDDRNSIVDWLSFINKQGQKAYKARGLSKERVERSCLVKIAAVAVAALESIDRKKFNESRMVRKKLNKKQQETNQSIH